jgi:hypothetical protein
MLATPQLVLLRRLNCKSLAIATWVSTLPDSSSLMQVFIKEDPYFAGTLLKANLNRAMLLLG